MVWGKCSLRAAVAVANREMLEMKAAAVVVVVGGRSHSVR